MKKNQGNRSLKDVRLSSGKSKFIGLSLVSSLFMGAYMLMSMNSTLDLSMIFRISNTDNIANEAEAAFPPEVIGGVVFRDYQNDGVIGIDDQRWDIDELPSQLIMTAFDADNNVVGTTSPDAAGNWSMMVELPVRLEITNLPTGYLETEVGVGHIPAVSIISTAGMSYHFGMCHFADIVEINPRIVSGCLAFGGGNLPIVASWNYNTRVASLNGRRDNAGHTVANTPHALDIYYNTMGHVWGVANKSETKQIFFSALDAPAWAPGPLGNDGIYLANYNGPGQTFQSVSPFIDLGSIGVDVSGDGTRWGQRGLGGMAINQAENTLYVVNVGQKEIIVLDIGDNATPPTTFTTLAIPDPGCTGGQWRPYALEQRRDILYLGGVCDASTSTESNMYFYIYSYDLNNPGAGWQEELSRVMDWQIGRVHAGPRDLFKWSAADNIEEPQPQIIDIGFDVDGSMIISLHVRARFNTLDLQPTGHFYRAHKNVSGFTLESGGVSGPYVSDAFNLNVPPGATGSGGIPGNGDLFFSNNCCQHASLGSGGIAVVNGTQQILTGQADPTSYGTFGVVYNDALDGSGDYGHILGSVKAAFVTDMGVISDESSLQIGKNVWVDENKNGIQDANELPVPNLPITIIDVATNTIVVVDVTDANGHYDFNKNEDGLQPDTEYAIVFGYDGNNPANSVYNPATGQFALNGAVYSLTTTTPTDPVATDENDSDPVVNTAGGVANYPMIIYTTSTSSDYSLDMGLAPVPFDYGDLADAGAGTAEQDYETLVANSGPCHEIVSDVNGNPLLKIGVSVDDEADGQPSADADGDGADEDGFDPTAQMFITGQPQDITFPVMNMTGSDAKLTLFIDWNNDGDFDDTDEMYSVTVADGDVTATINSITPPLTATLNDDLGFRIRISTDMAASMSPTGVAPDGEVEDYEIIVMGFDYGDLVDGALGTGEQDYETASANNGPSHKIITNENDEVLLKIGVSVDDEADGQPSADADGDGADEDGFDPTAQMFITGQPQDITFPVMNMTGSDAKLTLFIDWNNDGDFDDTDEMYSVTVADGDVTATINSITPPLTATLNDDLGFRIRISTDMAASMNPTGVAPDGEVEDYEIIVMGFDYGDLVDGALGTGEQDYETASANNGPSHKIITNENDEVLLKIGVSVDDEADGQPSADADGDGADEDGFDPTAQMFITGQPQDITFPVMNMTGSDAKLTLFIDWNNDGDFDDTDEMYSVTVADGDVTATINSITPPLTATLNDDLGFRIRISTDMVASMSPTGVAPDGEVEDYEIIVMGFDYGDLPDAAAGTGQQDYETIAANGGPSHKIITDENDMVLLKIGASAEDEADGQASADALGDDTAELNDEDGVVLPMFITGNPVDIPVDVMNMTGSEAKLVMFVDWNNDGDFDDVEEMYSLMVADGTNQVTFMNVIPPLTANLAEPVGIRFRISTDMAAVMSPTGPAPDGEVEDYLSPSMGFDYGDLNDVALGTTGDPGQPLTPADYQTTIEDNGARHKIITDVNDNPILKIGAAVDDEANGQPSADAGETGGDDNSIAPGTSDPDDEDGLDVNNLPLFIVTLNTALDVPVMNMTGQDATIAAFLDFNKDGFFDPVTEKFTALVPDQATMVTINILVPVNAVIGQDVGLRIRLANDMAEIMAATGEAQSGEVEDYMVQIIGFDYGDLPDTYGTSDPDGPKHIVNENLTLGNCVDVELDGIPEPMAGLMAGGDDADPGIVTFGTCATPGADEEGVEFVTPLIPGNEACVEVTSVNNTGADAVLQMWVDYNGDGDFDAGEEVTFTSANANTVPDGGVIDEWYCFDIPVDATFEGGVAFIRFRLSPNGGTLPDSQDLNTLQFGEVEDYVVPLYKVGSYVWDDLNGNGLQDDFSSPCMDDMEMQLVWAGPDGNLATTGDNQIYLVNSDEVNGIHGQFIFCGLTPGTYEMAIADMPSGLAPTIIGAGGNPNFDSNDPLGVVITIPDGAVLPTGEDGIGDMPGNGWPDNQENLSLDFGLVTDGYTITCNCDGSITLDWDPFAGGDSWTVTLEDENGLPALDFVNMPDHIVTIAPGSLNNGECYRVAITENLSGNEVTSIYGPFHANCYPVPEISMTGVGPTCPDSQDGEVTITITEQGCAATYDVYLTSQNGADLLVGDDIQITAPIVVPGLGEDTYGVRMELVDRGNCAYGDGCFPLIENDLLFLQNTDTEPPTKTVYDASGAEVTDMVINYDALPEGECGVQFMWSVVLNDNCLSAGVNLVASITTSSANPSVSPSASVTVLDNTPTYAVEVFAGVGTNTLTLTATDFNGNENVMVYTINVADNRDPVLYCPSDMNVEIPSCEDEAPVNWTVSVVDDCDLSPTLSQTSGPASGDILSPGIHNVSYEASDDYGNTGSCSFTITVTQAPSPAPIVDVSGNGNYEIEHCEEDGFIVFSGNVYDCDLDVASFNPADLIVQTIPLSADAAGSLQISYTLPQDGYVYFEATGDLTAGSYLIITTYQGVTVDHGVIVSQDADEPAVIDMPGNLSYQAADCEAEVPVSFAVQLSDDCDEDMSSAIFTVNGSAAPPYDAAASDPVNGLYVWNLHLSAGTYTIGCTYTDGGGNVSQEESTITVNGTQDDWAPIITYPSQNMDVELDPCGPPTASVVFEVTATDDCDGDLTPTVAISGGSLTNVGGTNTYIAMVSAGDCETVTITATDAAGNTRTEDFQICVNQAPAPLAALICNDDINVTLNDNCQREITADMLLEGEFGCFDNNNFTITIQDDDPSNGNILDGCGEFIYEIDLNVAAPTIGFTGDFAAANWSVVEDAGSGDAYVDFTSTTLTLGTLAGNDAIAMIPMPGDGTISFDYDYSGADPSWDFFIVDLDGNQIIDVTDPTTGSYSTAVEAGWMLVFHVDDDGAFPVGPNDPSEAVVSNFVFAPAAALPGSIDFQPCWGYITGEDKTAPVLECPASTGTGTIVKNGYILSGTIDTNDPTVVVNDWSCLIDNTQGSFPGERYVDIIPFQVDESDVYTFLVESDVTQTGNVGFAIYQGGYDVDNPCENIIAQADIPQAPGVGNPLPGSQGNDAYVRLALPLQAGATYYLATTTFTPEATGNYQYSICSDENGQVGYFDTTYVTNPDWSVDEIVSFTPVPTSPVTIDLPLHCEDFDAIYNNPSSLSLVGSPIVSDNCDQDVEVTFEDTYEQFGDCGDIVITRTFTAVDDKGNSSTCTQVITLSSVIANNRGDTEVWLPPFTVPIECDEDYPTLANGNPTPAIAGYPFVYTVSGIFDLTQGQYCNVGVSFEDSPSIVVCDGAFKFTRTWTIVDWCNPIDFYTYSQIIKVGDFTAPTVICPGEDYDWDGVLDAPVYSTSPFACTAAFEVPLPAVEDNCSDYEVYTEIVTAVEVDVVDQYGQVTGTELDTVTVRIVEWDAATRYVSGIPMGDHYFYYSVEDDCGNQTEVYCPFSVEDQIEPTAVCDDDLHVSIAGNDYARIYAEDINEGSWDNCGIASIEVRRNLFDPINFTCGSTYSTWGDYVDFFCCDAGVEIEIQLRVIDESGNVNTCWLTVTPEEKVRPYCEAPHNVEVDCTELPYDFDAYDTDQLESLFGSAIATDNCSGATADELPPVVDLECGYGRIIRRFRATDEAGNQSTNFCQQIVDIHEVHNYEIRFPADAEAICGVAEPDSVIYEELACDLLAVSHTDEFFSASGEECYKIFRTWKVINWCEYDGESAPMVIGRDEDCDGQPGDEAVWVLRRPNGYTYIDRDDDETEPNNVPLAFQNICQGWDDFWRKEDTTPGYYEYTQIIKVYDDIDPEITGDDQSFCSYDNVNCDGVVAYEFSVEENCTPEDLTIKVFLDAGADGGIDVNLTESGAFGFSLTGTYPDYVIGGEYPIGCHAFEVHVEDGCGNVNAQALDFCVEDCKAPAPICINGLAIELMPFDVDGDDVPDEGRMAIWASDFIASPITDCSEPVVYSMNRAGEPKNIDSTGIVLTCADTGTLVVEIWAWDAAGNSDFCETYINVQDNMGNCGTSSPGIAGAVATEYESPVEDVTMNLSGQGTASMQTEADGTYSFAGLVEGYDYTIIPERDGDYLNGVSTFDLVLISQHILGVQLLDSPYKRIAADVNNSESITTLDLIQLRKLILSIDTEFSNNTSWRFVDAAYVFPNPLDPWQEEFPELVNVNDLSEYGIAGLDFIAVKIGDVTEDAETTSLLAVEGREMEEVMYLKASEVAMKAGEEYTVNFSIEELQNIYGYQATLNFNTEAVELVDILEGVAGEDNFGFTYLDEGLVATSWNWVPDTEEELPTTVMYSLVVRAKADANLSEVMSVNSRITKAEAYATSGEFMDVELSFGLSTPIARADRFELYQNQPNPTNGETLIGFNLPEAATATLTISDITGKAIKLIRLDAVKGYNSVMLNAKNLPKGVLQYTVKAGQYTETKSMIITE